MFALFSHSTWFVVLSRYCPGGPDSDFEYSTQSYTGYEPTSMRAIRSRYDPYSQARNRIEQVGTFSYTYLTLI